MLCNVMFCHFMLCYIMLCYIMLCYIMLYYCTVSKIVEFVLLFATQNCLGCDSH